MFEFSAMRTPEGYEKDDIKKFLDSLGEDCWYFSPYMRGMGKNGVPDIVGCYKGHFFSIEVKREGKRPTALQNRRMGEIRTASGQAFAGTAGQVIGVLKVWLRFPDVA